SLRSHRGTHAASDALRRLVRKVQVFGLHLVPLDIREDARLQAVTLDELFRRYGIVAHYAALPEADKQALLSREIANPRPFCVGGGGAVCGGWQRSRCAWLARARG